MHMNLVRSTLALAVLAVAAPAVAQNREHQQMSAELRMLQEQTQQLAPGVPARPGDRDRQTHAA